MEVDEDDYTRNIASEYIRNIHSYIIAKSVKDRIPSMEDIVGFLGTLPIAPSDFESTGVTYAKLCYRIYLMTFMVHYKMPLQRTNPPGKRCTWINKLKMQDLQILNQPNIVLAKEHIKEDEDCCSKRSDILECLAKCEYPDIANHQLFHEWKDISQYRFIEEISHGKPIFWEVPL